MWRTVVRLDPAQSSDFRSSQIWDRVNLGLDTVTLQKQSAEDVGKVVARPFSGHERNRTFIRNGDNFDDWTLVSGADFQSDGRSFTVADFDHDGYVDLAVTSPNSPRLRILKNQFKSLGNHQSKTEPSFIQLTLEGKPKLPNGSPRDAIGAKILVETTTRKQAYLYACGEGLSAQNSRVIHVGLGNQKLKSIRVTWPNGNVNEFTDVKLNERNHFVEAAE